MNFSQQKHLSKCKISLLCNENSLLYEAYVTNGDCLVALNDKLSTCEDKARSVFVAYEEFQSRTVRERDDTYKGNNGLCVLKSFKASETAMCVLYFNLQFFYTTSRYHSFPALPT